MENNSYAVYLDKDNILKNDADNSPIQVSQYEALGQDSNGQQISVPMCPAGTHLPTARELGEYASSHGAQGVLDYNSNTNMGSGVGGYVLKRPINPDGKNDYFYYNPEGYSKPDGLGREIYFFWTSSNVISDGDGPLFPKHSYVFDAFLGKLKESPQGVEFAVRCFEGNPLIPLPPETQIISPQTIRLCRAIHDGDCVAVKAALTDGADPQGDSCVPFLIEEFPFKMPPLGYAVEFGFACAIRAIAASPKVNPNGQMDNKNLIYGYSTPASYLILNGRMDGSGTIPSYSFGLFQSLIEASGSRFDPDQKYLSWGQQISILQYAAQATFLQRTPPEHLESPFAEYLLDHFPSINVDKLDPNGSSPLHELTSHAPQLIPKILSRSNLNVNLKDLGDNNHKGFTPLMYAWSDFTAVMAFLNYPSIDVNVINDEGQNALLHFYSDIDQRNIQNLTVITQTILGKGLNPIDLQEPATERSALTKLLYQTYLYGYTAPIDDSIGLQKILLDRHANPNLQDINGQTPLHYIAHLLAHNYVNNSLNAKKIASTLENIRLLVNFGADGNIFDHNQQSPKMMLKDASLIDSSQYLKDALSILNGAP